MVRGATLKTDVIDTLKREILSLQGHKKSVTDNVPSASLGPIQSAFPESTFPIGAVHEFISYQPEDAAATTGFMSGIVGQLMKNNGTVFWIAPKRTAFPPALKIFGMRPQRIIFIELTNRKQCLWAIEEVLKCKSVTAVIGEIQELTFAESRRLQLAVENSNVTGFIHRYQPRSEHAVACVSRWKITQLPSETDIPGVGMPRWNVELTKVRNGKPGIWQLEWNEKRFQSINNVAITIPALHNRKTG